MKSILILLLLLPSALTAQKHLKLSPNSRISVITCGPGQNELYSAFGHSAFRVYDPASNIDLAYNYGVFDFDQPHFYLNFARGYLYYMLGVHDYKAFQYHYLAQGRYVHEQILNLNPEQNQQLFNFLQENALPENASYRYDYFYDNCATQIRDVVLEVFADAVSFDMSYIQTSYSIRQLTDIYIRKQQPWGDLGIDICLGLPMDKRAAPHEYMFLPDYIESGFANATIMSDSGRVSLVKNTIKMGEDTQGDQSSFIKPLYCFVAVALIGALLSFYDFRKRRASHWFDITWLSITGAIGLLLVFLWFFTDHAAAAENFNLLWAVPLNIIAAIAFIKNAQWLKGYFAALAVLSVATLLAYRFLPQQLHFSLIPLIVMMALRSFTQFKLRKSIR